MKQNSKTEFDKMKSGELFNPADKSFLFPLAKAEYYQRRLNKAAVDIIAVQAEKVEH
jgi:hypothetical protein